MTPFRVSIAAAVAAVILLLVILELIRSRRLQERYALLWLLTGFVILILAAWRSALARLADLVGIAYPPSALFVLASIFVLVARHRLRMVEVPVKMRIRETGSSSITALRSVYYMVKVLLALFIGLFRRYSTPLEEP